MKRLYFAFILALLFNFACSSNKPQTKNLSPAFSLQLQLGKKLSKDGLKAELGIYKSENMKLYGSIKELSINENGNNLSVKIDETLELGSYVIRIYLIHEKLNKLIWVGEWEVVANKAGAEIQLDKLKNKSIKDKESAKDQLKGDKNDLVQKANGDMEKLFETDGKSNLDQACQPGAKSCENNKPKACKNNGFGYDLKDQCSDDNAKSIKCEAGQCKISACNKGYKQKEGKCQLDEVVKACGPSKKDCTNPQINPISDANASPACVKDDCSFICKKGFHYNDPKQPSACFADSTQKSCGSQGENCDDKNKSGGEYKCQKLSGASDYSCILSCLKGFHQVGQNCIDNKTPSSCGEKAIDCTKTNPKNSEASCDGTKCGFKCEEAKNYYLKGQSCQASPANCAVPGEKNAKTMTQTWDKNAKKWGACQVIECQTAFCLIAGKCMAKGSLNPQNPCEECDPAKNKTGYSVDNTNAYDDGKFCTKNDSCKNGKPFSETNCVDGLTCTDDNCDEAGDKCTNPFKKGKCLIGGKCYVEGAKQLGKECVGCNSKSSKKSFSNLENGTVCDDKLYCTESSKCDGSGTCQPDKSKDCGSGKYCVEDSDSCKTHACPPGKNYCDGSSLKTCDGLGSGPTGSGQTCTLGCASKLDPQKCVDGSIKVANLKITVVSDSSIKLVWDAASSQTGSTSYKIQRSTSASSGFSHIKTLSSTTFIDSSLSAETIYYYKVQIIENGKILTDYVLGSAKTNKKTSSIKEYCIGGECLIPKGSFKMGSPSFEPGREAYLDETHHDVTITYDFYMSQTEVTQGEWKAAGFSNPSNFSSCGDNCPVDQVNWWEALHYANKKSKSKGLEECYAFTNCNGNALGADKECDSVEPAQDFDKNGKKETKDLLKCKGYRLPTEAEWEYAARAGTITAFYNGAITQTGKSPLDNKLNEIGYYGGNSKNSPNSSYNCSSWYTGASNCGPHPVKGKIKNAFGLYDMSGNVWEWVFDWYAVYQSGPPVDPLGASGDSYRVRRGGSWVISAQGCRSADRDVNSPGDRNGDVGFRLARSDSAITSAPYKPIKLASSNNKECKVCTDWTDEKTCKQPATCPKEGEAGYGQEGNKIGNQIALSFSDNGNGTLTDNNTGYIWTKCAGGASGNDCKSGTAVGKTWADAKSHCAGLASSKFAGFNDWRLPHIKELLLIQDFNLTTNPPINKTFFENLPDGKNIWSATEYKHSDLVGKIYTANPASTSPEAKTKEHYTLCTRGKAFANDFKDNADGTITDKATNLVWQKCSSGQNKSDANCASDGSTSTMNWKDALAYCQNLNLGGHKDWQLPSIREFQTLMDYDKNSSSGPYIDAIFKGNPNKWYWSRTPRVGSASDAWRVSFYAGISYYLVSNSGRVRCFRPGPF